MKAVGFYQSHPIDHNDSLIDLNISQPKLKDHDLLVEIVAVSVNPIDIKLRSGLVNIPLKEGEPRIMGFDASGIVREIGSAVTGFKPGDEVFYAGAIDRPGSNAEFQAIDSRLVAHKPKHLDFAAAAALPLTSLTGWEMLFDRLAVERPVSSGRNTLLITGAGGGVGSITLQLARLKTDLLLIATASRPESKQWAEQMGAHIVIDHKQPIAPQLQTYGIDQVDFIFSTAGSDQYLPQFSEIIAPQGRFGLIDDPQYFDTTSFKFKSVSIHWESMFTRAFFQTDDMDRQGKILAEIASLIESEQLKPTVTERLAPLNAETLRAAHKKIESNQTIGKIVITKEDGRNHSS